MRLALVTIALALLPGLAEARPPATGTVHTFYDPMFQATVFCDTVDQVRDIATAEEPGEVYRGYLETLNARNEPYCAAIIPTGVVVNVLPIGMMVRDGLHFRAWAVETRVGDITGYALYLEHVQIVSV